MLTSPLDSKDSCWPLFLSSFVVLTQAAELLCPTPCATEPRPRIPFRRRTSVSNRGSNPERRIIPAASTHHPVVPTGRAGGVPLRALVVVQAVVSVCHPFSHIARHIEQPKGIGLIRPHRRGGDCAIVVPGQNDRQTIPAALIRDVGNLARARREIPPPIDCLCPSSSGIFKLSLRR